jgi:lactate dehydrogenase-like 2-hydroxyacid dehydrogenase
MKTIGFLTPYEHLPEFSKFAKSNFKCINMVGLLKNKLNIFKSVDYIFAAPNYLKYIIEQKDIEGTNIKGIITPSTGDNHINVSIPVISIKNDSILEEIYSTAEHNLYLCLALPRQIGEIVELKEKTLGILGYGRLGKILEKITKPLFKKIVKADTNFIDDNFFSDSDFLSINIDYKKSNTDYINAEFVGKFRKNIYIVNTSRGEVVNEIDIIKKIHDGKVLGYATDVIKEEHTPVCTVLKDNHDKRLLRTPHIGGTAIEAQEKAYKRVIEKVYENNI